MIRFQYLKEHRNSVRIDDDSIENGENNSNASPSPNSDDLLLISTLMCEYMMATSQFVQFGYDYYEYVCGTDKTSSQSEEKSCLIPVCSFQPLKTSPSSSSKVGNKRGPNDDDSSTEKTTLNFANDSSLQGDKRQRLDKSTMNVIRHNDDRGSGLDSYCVNGVDEALQILSRAGDCLRHIVELWQWATDNMSSKSATDLTDGWEKGKPKDNKPATTHTAYRTYSSY